MQARIARTTLSRALSAAILGMAATGAMAQEQDATAQAQAGQQAAPAEQVTDLDSVVVKGFRQSLQGVRGEDGHWELLKAVYECGYT